jgi:hypothetical protein
MARQKRRRRHVWKGPVLENVNLQGYDLRGYSYCGYGLRNAILVGTNFAGCEMQGVDLALADLTRCNLAGADLYEADLRGANLSEAILTGANLRDAIYDAATRWPSGFEPRASGAVEVSQPVSDYSHGCRALTAVEIAFGILGLAGGYLIGRRNQASPDVMVSAVLLGAVTGLIVGLIAYTIVGVLVAHYRQPYLD